MTYTLSEIEAACAAATPVEGWTLATTEEGARFARLARTALPELVARVRELEQRASDDLDGEAIAASFGGG